MKKRLVTLGLLAVLLLMAACAPADVETSAETSAGSQDANEDIEVLVYASPL